MNKIKMSCLILCGIILISPGMAQQTTDTVRIRGNDFIPAELTVIPGAAVVWINESITQHTTTSGSNCKKDEKWDSGLLEKDSSFSYTFDSEGVFPYYCIPHCHQGMTGVIVVGEETPPKSEKGSSKKKVKK